MPKRFVSKSFTVLGFKFISMIHFYFIYMLCGLSQSSFLLLCLHIAIQLFQNCLFKKIILSLPKCLHTSVEIIHTHTRTHLSIYTDRFLDSLFCFPDLFVNCCNLQVSLEIGHSTVFFNGNILMEVFKNQKWLSKCRVRLSLFYFKLNSC